MSSKNGNHAPLLADGEPTTIEECHKFPNEEFEKMSLRQRMAMYHKVSAGENATLPVPLLFFLHAVMGLVWYGGFRYLVLDLSEDFWSELNIRRFIIYNILHGLLGFGASWGPLGMKNKVMVMANFLTALTPGSMCSPLFPGLVGLIQKTPGRRGLPAIIAFVTYLASLIYAIQHPSVYRVSIAVACLFIASVFDAVQFFASRGEHYGYHLICMMFPDWIAGAQWIQLMLWIMVGFSKLGPWFKYVVQVLVKDAIWTPCLPRHFSAKVFMKDWPRDHSPSDAIHVLKHLGAILEWVFPICCTFSHTTYPTVNLIGVAGMILYHAFIWMTMPTASVFEWQYYAQFMTYFLYYKHDFALPSSPGLLVFIAIVSFILPIVGQLYPKLVPFLMAYRQYSGNWRLGWWVIKKSARPKIEKIKTWNPIFHWEAAPPEFGGERFEYNIAASFMVVPQFRGIFSIFEKFRNDHNLSPDEFYYVNAFAASNALFGWDLAVGWLWFRDVFRTALCDMAGFAEGECYVLQCEPVPNLPPHNLQYRFMDVTKGPMDAEIFVDVPYSYLEQGHPMEVKLTPDQMKSGKSINGMFLSTYY